MKNLSVKSTEAAENQKQKTAATTTKSKSVLEAFEYIVELAEKSSLDKDFFDKAATHIKYASRKLHLTHMQTVLLAQFVDRSENRCIRLSDIAEYTGCRTTKFLRLADDIDELESKRYISASRRGDSLSYRVTAKVLAALRKNQQYIHQ